MTDQQTPQAPLSPSALAQAVSACEQYANAHGIARVDVEFLLRLAAPALSEATLAAQRDKPSAMDWHTPLTAGDSLRAMEEQNLLAQSQRAAIDIRNFIEQERAAGRWSPAIEFGPAVTLTDIEGAIKAIEQKAQRTPEVSTNPADYPPALFERWWRIRFAWWRFRDWCGEHPQRKAPPEEGT